MPSLRPLLPLASNGLRGANHTQTGWKPSCVWPAQAQLDVPTRRSKNFCLGSTPGLRKPRSTRSRLARNEPADLFLADTICIKHTRRVTRDKTVKFQWRVLKLLPRIGRQSYAGLQVELLERADEELMIRYRGGVVNFQEAPQPSTAL